MIYLRLDEVMAVARAVVGPDVAVRDIGLVEAAIARPQTTVFGVDAYPSIEEKAAALLHSVVKNHALVDGNKRLGLGALIAFLGMNGQRLTFTNDEAYDFVMSVADGTLDEVSVIAGRLKVFIEPR